MSRRTARLAGFTAGLVSLALLFLISITPALADETDLNAVLQKAYTAWSKVSTWQADFTQTSLYRGVQIRKEGHVVYSTHDGKLAAHYTQPQETVVAINGNRAVAYYPSRQAADQVVSPFVENLPRLLQAGQPPEVVKLAYDIQWTKPPNPNFYSIDFTPRVPFPVGAELTKIRIEYDKTSVLPVGAWIFYKGESWVRSEYRRAQVNATVGPAAFEVKLPAGTKINNAPDLNGVLGGLLGLTTAETKKP